MINFEKLKTKLIFIQYIPGSFGSFLYHTLMGTDQCVRYTDNTINIMDSQNSAHLNIFDVIKNFHSNEEVLDWKNFQTIEEKQKFIFENLNDTIVETDLYQPPKKIATYNAAHELRNIFPKSIRIFITFEKQSIDIIARIIEDKLYNNLGLQEDEKIIKLLDNLKNLNKKDIIIHEYCKKNAKYFYEMYSTINPTDDEYIMSFESFFTYEKFIKEFSRLLKKFNMTADEKYIEKLYEKFYNTNMKYFRNK